MKNSSRSDAVIELGKKILGQFDKREDLGILTSWMSHHVAELITRAENEKDRTAAEEARQACVEGILKLWSHRNSLPDGFRPFEDAEMAVKTLVRLSPDSNQNFFFRGVSPPKDDSNARSADAKAWLEFAEGFDKEAKEVIRFCLAQSFSTAGVELREWINMSQGLREPLPVDIEIVYKLIEDMPDEELEETINPDNTKAVKALAQLDKIIENLVDIRKAIELKLSSD